jgi:hypothetical protein
MIALTMGLVNGGFTREKTNQIMDKNRMNPTMLMVTEMVPTIK